MTQHSIDKFHHFGCRVAMAPIYYIPISILITRLMQYKGLLWLLIYLVAAILSLVPAHLFELRYFTPGIVIAMINYRFHSTVVNEEENNINKDKSENRSKVALNGLIISIALNYVMNFMIFYIFLYKPFYWPDGSMARFMF